MQAPAVAGTTAGEGNYGKMLMIDKIWETTKMTEHGIYKYTK